MLAVGKCGSPFIAVVRRAPDGYGYKSSKLLQQHSIPFLPSGFSLRVLSTYLERWNRRQTSFINYGTVRPTSPLLMRDATAPLLDSTPPVLARRLSCQAKELPLYSAKSEDAPPRAKVNLRVLRRKYDEGVPISMVTAYDYPSARLADAAGLDMLLVGDSVGMVVLGQESTVSVDMAQMLHHCKAVHAGAPNGAFLVGDLPFGSYLTPESAMNNAVRLLKEGRMDAVKLEGGARVVPQVKAIVDAGVNVVGHIGLTPQTASSLGGYCLQGKDVAQARELMDDALALQKAGCIALVLEMVPQAVAQIITDALHIPTIGIGAGCGTNGQVQVLHDLLGMYDKFMPRFAKRYAMAGSLIEDSLARYKYDVEAKRFPTAAHSFSIKKQELAHLQTDLIEAGLLSEAATSQPLMHQPLTISDDTAPLGVDTELPPLRKIVVIGGGALGSLFASKLVQGSDRAETQVVILSKWQEQLDAVHAKGGLRVLSQTGSGEAVVPVNMLDSAEAVGTGDADLVLVAVKSQDTEAAAVQAARLLAPDGVAITLQNGMGNFETLQHHCGHDRVLAGVTSQAARLDAPGVLTHTGNGSTLLVTPPEHYLGNEPEDGSAALLRLRALQFRGTIYRAASDPSTAPEVALLSSGNHSAVLGVPNGFLASDPHQEAENLPHQNLMTSVLEEAVRVMQASGVSLDPDLLSVPDELDDHGQNPRNAAFGSLEQVTAAALAKARYVASITATNHSSMLNDVWRAANESGGGTEIEAINGFIVREGKRIGVPTPTNEMLCQMVRAQALAEGKKAKAPVQEPESSTSAVEADATHHALAATTSPGLTGQLAARAAVAAASGEPLVLCDTREMRQYRRFLDCNTQGSTPPIVGLVPTMGALHDGHMELVRQAREICDIVLVSIFVNPAQFSPDEDFDQYPRQLRQDVQMLATDSQLAAIHAARLGKSNRSGQEPAVAAVFAPQDPNDMYPNDPPFRTYVEVQGIDSDSVEGSSRPGFFRGVATVCTKLFHLAQPDHVFFGQKDGVQCIVIKQLVRDLDFPCDVHVVPTCREEDGLAISSRNVYLTDQERALAPVVFEALQAAAALVPYGPHEDSVAVRTLKQAAAQHVATVPDAHLEYISIADNQTGQELADEQLITPTVLRRRGLLLSTAVQVGSTRLIDNLPLEAGLMHHHRGRLGSDTKPSLRRRQVVVPAQPPAAGRVAVGVA